MKDYDYFLKKVNDFHGHTCMGIVMGTLISLAAMEHLGLDPHQKSKNIIAYVEIDRCMTDAVMVVTGCYLGRRSLKHIDYGKFAVTLVDQILGRAVRATARKTFSSSDSIDDALKLIASVPTEELVILQDVQISIPETDLPGLPTKRAICSLCGETIMDGRDVDHNGIVTCRGCAQGTYYSKITE